jgi:pseudouridine synthase
MAQNAVCEAASQHAVALMKARGLEEAATVVFDVPTGALVAFASLPAPEEAARPIAPLNVTTLIAPLSLAKLFLAASWWDRGLPDRSFDCVRSATPDKPEPMTIPEMIVTGCDLPAKQMAVALRKKIGTEGVLADLERFGFGPQSKSARDGTFWAELAPDWRSTLAPAAPYTLLNARTNDSEWAAHVTAPETHLDKTYHVQIGAIASDALLEALRDGFTTSDGDFLRVKRVSILRQGERNSWLEIVLEEGKNRHIRRMFEHFQIEVLRLIRVAIGPLALGDLPKGAARALEPNEKLALDRAMQFNEINSFFD